MQQLDEKMIPEQITFIGVGGTTLGSSLGETYLSIKLNNGKRMWCKFFVVKNITSYKPTGKNDTWKKLTGKLADENYNQPGKINALLGVGIWIKIIEPQLLRSPIINSIAHQTKLGYVILEDESDPYQGIQPHIGSLTKGPSMKKLMEVIQKLWQIEEIPEERKRTKEEEMCEEIFVKGYSRNWSGRYIVRIPFKNNRENLGKSKKQALHQFFAMENRMKRNEEFAAKYQVFMSEYEALGHMEAIWEPHESGYYMPHHGVLSANKFRVVFNASAKTSSGITLNETQLVGEKLQKNLFIILMNFRKFKFGIIADIEKMYRQVLVHPEDRVYQKILWRENERDPIRTYQLKTVTYGHACAPHCAIRALIQCASDHEKEFPMGARLVKNCFYVDDLLTGADNETEVMKVKFEVTALLKKGGFNITKWKSNGEIQEIIELKENDESSVLGLYWNLSTDKFFYKIRDIGENDILWTKRKILSKIGKMYDPHGFLGPIIMRGKLIIQELWKDHMDWDEEVKGEIKSNWKLFHNDLANIHIISINRWMGTLNDTKMQLHGFCDASEKGYGAVIYSRVRDGAKYRTELIISKSRVAPLKVITIPRLELCAADLLTKLMELAIPVFSEGREIQNFCWSDSQVVLHWIKKPAISFKRYVANRVEKIQTISDELKLKWKWVKGEDNPADLIS